MPSAHHDPFLLRKKTKHLNINELHIQAIRVFKSVIILPLLWPKLNIYVLDCEKCHLHNELHLV